MLTNKGFTNNNYFFMLKKYAILKAYLFFSIFLNSFTNY